MQRKAENLYFLFVLLFSGLSTSFFRSKEGLIVLWAVGVLVFWKTLLDRGRSQQLLLLSLGVWMGYFTISTVSIGSFHPFFMGTYIAKIMIAWCLLFYFKDQIFKKFEDAIYYLVIVSLVFYGWQVISPGSLYAFMNKIDLSQRLFPDKMYANILIYTFNEIPWRGGLPRNAGFTWEPGPFSCYIVLALLFNLFRNNMKLKDTNRIVVFVTAVLTTQSTTGLLGLLTLVFWYFWVKIRDKNLRVIAVPMTLVVIFYVFTSVPYLKQKIIDQSQQDLDKIIYYSNRYGGEYNPGRFASFQLGWQDFKNYPLAGIGGNVSLRYAHQMGAHVATINGLANIMTRYGSIGLAIFLYLIFATGRWLSRFYQTPGYMVFPAIMLVISFAFGIIEQPMMVTLWMVPIFLSHKTKGLQLYASKGTLFHRKPTLRW